MHLSLASHIKFEVTIYASGPPPQEGQCLEMVPGKGLSGRHRGEMYPLPTSPWALCICKTAPHCAPDPGHQFAELNSVNYLVA